MSRSLSKNIWSIKDSPSKIIEVIRKFCLKNDYEETRYDQSNGITYLEYRRPRKSFEDELNSPPKNLIWKLETVDESIIAILNLGIDTRFKWAVRGIFLGFYPILFIPVYIRVMNLTDISWSFFGAYLVMMICLAYISESLLSRFGKMYKTLINELNDRFDAAFTNKIIVKDRSTGYPDKLFFMLFLLPIIIVILYASDFSFTDILEFKNFIFTHGLVFILLVGLGMLGFALVSRTNLVKNPLIFTMVPTFFLVVYCYSFLVFSLGTNYFGDPFLWGVSFVLGLFTFGIFTTFFLSTMREIKQTDHYLYAKEGSIFHEALGSNNLIWRLYVVLIWSLLFLGSYIGLFFIINVFFEILFDVNWFLFPTRVTGVSNFFRQWGMMIGELFGITSFADRLVGIIIFSTMIYPVFRLLITSFIRFRKSLHDYFSFWDKLNINPKSVMFLKNSLDLRLKSMADFDIALDPNPANKCLISTLYAPFFTNKKHLIILPEKLLDEEIMTELELRSIIAHEIYHLKYHLRDLWWLRILGTVTLCGSNFLTAALNFYEHEFDADDFAARYIGREAISGAIRKIKMHSEKHKPKSRLNSYSFSLASAPSYTSVPKKIMKYEILEKLYAKWYLMLNHFSGFELTLRYMHPIYESRLHRLETDK